MNPRRAEAAATPRSEGCPARLLIIDDHPIVREGLKTFLREVPGIQVVGEAGSGAEALERVTREAVDLVTLDICLPDMDGIELMARLRGVVPSIQVLCLSMYPSRTHAQRALRAGASGYLEKTEVGDKLLTAISSMLAGRRYIDPDTAAMLLSSGGPGESAAGAPRLTGREREIMWLLASGDEIKEVARKLELSPKTVAAHRAHLLDKLGVRNNVELAKYLQDNPQLRFAR